MEKKTLRILFITMLFIIGVQINFVEASFERKYTSAKSAALSDSLSSLFETKEGIYFERSLIQPIQLERSTFVAELSIPKGFINLTYDSFGDKEVDAELSYFEKVLAIKLVYNLFGDIVDAGIRLNKFDVDTAYTGNGLGLDFGVLIHPTPNLSLGLELVDTWNYINYSTGHSEENPVNSNLFIQFAPFEKLNIYSKVSSGDGFSIGCEYFILSDFSARLGLNNGHFSAGLGIGKNIWHFDYSLYHDLLGTQQTLGVCRKF